MQLLIASSFYLFSGSPVGGSGLIQTFVRCSDPNIICDTKTVQQGEPQDVFLKVATIKYFSLYHRMSF